MDVTLILPDDLLHDIFTLASCDETRKLWRGFRSRVPKPVSMLLTPYHIASTSQRWRRVALDTPHMWSGITVPKAASSSLFFDTRGLLTWFQTSLNRSGSAPLTVNLLGARFEDLANGLQLQLITILVQHCNRIKILIGLIGDIPASILAAAPGYPKLEICDIVRLNGDACSLYDSLPFHWSLGVTFMEEGLVQSTALQDLQLELASLDSIELCSMVLGDCRFLSAVLSTPANSCCFFK